MCLPAAAYPHMLDAIILMLKIVISLFTVNPLLAQPQADCMRVCAVCVCVCVCV